MQIIAIHNDQIIYLSRDASKLRKYIYISMSKFFVVN